MGAHLPPPDPEWPALVLDYWFRELSSRDWFAVSDATDETVRARFGDLHAWVSTAPLEALETSHDTVLAAIIVLDQFSRNLFRDRAEAFAQDDRALGLADRLIRRGGDAGLSVSERLFLYLPFEHSEAIADQDRSVALFEVLGDVTYLEFAQKHRDIIAQFGRFPHRNKVLGRISTPEETAFLEAQGRGF